MNGMLLLAITGIWLVACGPAQLPDDQRGGAPEDADGSPQLRVDRPTVRPAGEIRITLTNRTDALIGYNLCVAALERLEAGQWADVPERPAEICTMELRTLQPGGSDDFTHTIPQAVPPGVYRFRTGVESPLGDAQASVASDRFEVVR
jgi:hypothetical protein